MHSKPAKTFTVSGTVVDETDTPVPGASVYAKDRAGMGTATDVDGKFSLKVQKNDILVVSFLGYAPSETAITGPKSDLRIKLTPSEHQLEEAVVVGMGTQRKISVVGAVTNVNVKELQTPATNLANMLGVVFRVSFRYNEAENRGKIFRNSGSEVSERSEQIAVHSF